MSITSVFFFFISTSLLISGSHACNCSVPDHPCQTLGQSDILASGSVLRVQKSTNHSTITFWIQRCHKGDLTKNTVLNFSAQSSQECPMEFKKGKYLISLIETEDQRFYTDSCLFNQKLGSVSKDISKWLSGDDLQSCPVCPDGTQPLNCFQNPCDFQTDKCTNSSHCVPDYCGGCNARFYNEKNEEICQNCSVVLCDPCEYGYVYDPSTGCRTCQCLSGPNTNNTNTTCSDGSQPVTCFDNPCATQKQVCPEATRCVVNYCGGCNAKYYNQDGRQVCQSNQCPVVNCQQKCDYGYVRDSRGCQTCQCVATPTCANGTRPVTCLQNPCNLQSQQCPNASRCVPDYCGGCNAKYYNQSGAQICLSTNTTCSNGIPPKPCSNTCSVPSPDCSSAVRCSVDPCSQCSVKYYNKKGLQICRSKTL